ncbi:coiled-coil domain-containing protein 96 isoform X2 [Neoarius graeffei]|uniref:coiled-coil domain-containing protein 96 isoform X2 n=1 Tax=Neoarius graeffei TaxID=443677 RepID=UPI00298CFBE5|nr:coiled-coil domain-containing protein 96 isoform X2 [Neoarius graeffei]
MESEQSLEEKGPDVKSEDPNVAEAADVLDSENLSEPDVAEVDKEEELVQAPTEQDEDNMQNTSENPEEDVEASVIDELLVWDDVEECYDSGVNVIENENEEEEEPKNQVEDHKLSPADLQHNLKVKFEDEQKLLQELQTEHEKLSQLNYQLQAKLAEQFWFKSGGKLESGQEKSFSSQEYCQIIEAVKRQKEDEEQKFLHHRYVNELHRQNNEKLEQIKCEWNMLVSTMREVVVTDLEQAMSKTAAQGVAEHLLTAVQKCYVEFVSVKNENLKLNLQMARLEVGLHVSEEDQDEEMHHLDIEQVQIENQSYSEKIQECSDELLKFRRMLPHTRQILMQVKEKLRFVQEENQVKRVHFDELNALVLREQGALIKTMQERDVLRFDNLRKRQDCGLLGNHTLLRDFEDTEDEREALERQIENLKRDTQAHTDTHVSASACNTHAETQ